MSADPAFRPSRRPAPPVRQRPAAARLAPGKPSRRSAGVQQRRREQRFRQRRRDLRGDAAIAFVLAVSALIVAPGLGVIAIASIPVALALVGTVMADRRASSQQPGPTRSATGRAPQ